MLLLILKIECDWPMLKRLVYFHQPRTILPLCDPKCSPHLRRFDSRRRFLARSEAFCFSQPLFYVKYLVAADEPALEVQGLQR
ncbi:hypothetical protein AAC387_Pa12g1766 [Persea americana]